MAFTALAEPFFTYLKAALVGAFIIAYPLFVMIGRWQFLTRHLPVEAKRTCLPKAEIPFTGPRRSLGARPP